MKDNTGTAATLIPLQQVYLHALAQLLKSERLDTLVDEGPVPGAGTLYAVRADTTVAEIVIDFKFIPNQVAFNVNARDGRNFAESLSYVGGIDDYLKQLGKFIQAGRLAAPKRAA